MNTLGIEGTSYALVCPTGQVVGSLTREAEGGWRLIVTRQDGYYFDERCDTRDAGISRASVIRGEVMRKSRVRRAKRAAATEG